ALDYLAAMTTHIPNQGEQMVRYYGFYSNVSPGIRKKKIQMVSFPAL
ncbi:MAG: IS91 family transposase, partial [Desulfobacca sp.]|nr:IS91 family transposase [Desulfobacca sp.]